MNPSKFLRQILPRKTKPPPTTGKVALSVLTKTSPAQAGRLGAAKRWGPPRRVHLGDLTPEQREIVLAFIEAQRNASARRQSTPEAA